MDEKVARASNPFVQWTRESRLSLQPGRQWSRAADNRGWAHFMHMRTALCIALALTAGCSHRCTYTAREDCVANLRQLEGAKERWALEEHKSTNDTPTMKDIAAHSGGPLPECLAGGTYTLGRVGERPACSVTGHTLE